MEEIIDFVKINGTFGNYIEEYDEEENVHFWEACASVFFKNKVYNTIVMSMSKPSNKVPIYELAHKLAMNIIFDQGLQICNNLVKNKQFNILHRGNHRDFIENSFNALKYSVDYYDGFETDLRLSHDQYWVLSHDDNLKRIFNDNIMVSNTNAYTMQKKYGILELSDLLFTNKYNNKLINLEIKEDFNKTSIISKMNLINTIRKFKNNVIISSFDHKWYYYIKSYNIKFAHLINSIDEIPTNYDMIIMSNDDFKININSKKNVDTYGVYGIKEPINSINMNIIDL